MCFVIYVFLLFISLTCYSQVIELKNSLSFLALGDSYTIGQGVEPESRWPNQLIDALDPDLYIVQFLGGKGRHYSVKMAIH